MTPKKILAWTGAVLGAGGAITLLLWGVPYWIDAKVEAKFRTEWTDHVATIDTDLTDDGPFVELSTKLDGLDNRLNTMQGDLETVRDDSQFVRTKFIEFLEREANRNAETHANR